MLTKNPIYVAMAAIILLASCAKDGDTALITRWGKEKYYSDFLWKKHVPDTLYRELEFDFNEDAKYFMDEPLRLGLFKKAGSGKMLPVLDNEMEIFVDGKKCDNNIIDVPSSVEKLKVGIVFNHNAENKVHHWFFKPVSDGGLERINDMDADTFNNPDSSLLEVEAQKLKIMNPLAQGLLITCIIIIVVLLVWLLVLKSIFYPKFRVGKVTFCDPEPYMSQKKLRGCRLLILTSTKPHQSTLNRIFTGEIRYEVNPMWTTDVVMEPRDKNSVRVRASKEYLVDSRIMKVHKEYIIQNTTTGTKTKVNIS